MTDDKERPEDSGVYGAAKGPARDDQSHSTDHDEPDSLDKPHAAGKTQGRATGHPQSNAKTAPSGAGPQRQSGVRTNTRALNPEERRVPSEAPSRDPERRINVNIANRNGHYIFTVGRPGTGKSTLQSQVLRYLFESREYHSQIKTADESERVEQERLDKLLAEWRKCWRDDRFPERTAASRPSEFRFEVAPVQRNNNYITFGFFEVAGEDFETLRRGLSSRPSLLTSLAEFLRNPNCKFVFLLVCIGHEVENDDELFVDFLDYLRENFGERYVKESRVAIVISDPDEASALLAKKRKERGRSGKLDKEAFVREFLPQTAAKLMSWKRSYGLAQFYVGNIRADENGKEYIEGNSFDDARALFGWIFEAMTGLKPVPGPTLRERVGNFLQRFG